MTMERETASSNNTPQENESSGLAVAETTTPDSGIKKVEDPKSNAQYEDTVKKSVDGETNETPNITNGEEEGENPITVDKDEENEKIEDMKGNNMTQSVQDTSEDDELDDELGDEIDDELGDEIDDELSDEIDDEEDVMWEDDEEYSEEGSETAVAVDDEVNEEGAINEEENAEEDAENDEGNAEEGDQKKAEVEKKIVKGNVGEVVEHNKEKVEVILRNAKKSRRRRGNKVGEETLKKLDTGDKAGSSQKRKGKKRVESMGMIFICSSKTKKDCYKYRVLGLPESKKDMVEKIYTGMRLFLYDVDLKLMYGIYKAAGPGGYNIEPRAFKSQFPSQVRFTVLDDCLPLAEEKFKKIIQENYYTKTKFDCKLNSEQVKNLCKAFVSINKGQLPKNLGKKQLPVRRDITRRRKRGDDERRPPLREEARYERPRKRTRQQANSPTRQPLPPLIRSTVPLYPYNNNRTLDGEAYRRDLYLESRDPLLKRGDHYRDEHAPYLERCDPYRDRQDSYLVNGDQEPYLVQHNSEAYLMARDTESYLVGRESRDPYRLRRDPYPEHHRDGRASYLESRGLLEDGPRYRRDPHPPPPMLDYREDRRVVYRDPPPYRLEEVLESRRHDPYVSYREQRPLYAEAEALYYPTRSGMAREYGRL